MTAKFDTLAMSSAIERTRLGKAGSETVARAMHNIAMKDASTTQDVQSAINQAVHSLTVRIGAMFVASVTILLAAASILITLN